MWQDNLGQGRRTKKGKKETEKNMREAIEFHLEGMRAEGLKLPEPCTEASFVDIAA